MHTLKEEKYAIETYLCHCHKPKGQCELNVLRLLNSLPNFVVEEVVQT